VLLHTKLTTHFPFPSSAPCWKDFSARLRREALQLHTRHDDKLLAEVTHWLPLLALLHLAGMSQFVITDLRQTSFPRRARRISRWRNPLLRSVVLQILDPKPSLQFRRADTSNGQTGQDTATFASRKRRIGRCWASRALHRRCEGRAVGPLRDTCRSTAPRTVSGTFLGGPKPALREVRHSGSFSNFPSATCDLLPLSTSSIGPFMFTVQVRSHQDPSLPPAQTPENRRTPLVLIKEDQHS